MDKFSRLVVVGSSLLLSASALAVPANSNSVETSLLLSPRVPMQELAQSVIDPMSPRFGKPYSLKEIHDLAAPSQADRDALKASLKSQGFSVVSESPSGLLITIKADRSTYEKVLAGSFVDQGSRHSFISPLTRLPETFSIVSSISGLDTLRKSKPGLIVKEVLGKKMVRKPLDDQTDGLMPDYIKQIYGMDPVYSAGYTGLNVDIAIAGYDGYSQSDIMQYWDFNLLKPGPTLDEVTFNGTPGFDMDSEMETALDAEFSGHMAPGARIHLFLSAVNSDLGEVQLFTAILDDNRAKVVSYSWGDCESNVTAQHHQDMDAVFARAVAQGVNILAASGDSGSLGCPGSSVTTAGWPAADPYIFAIGGTTTGDKNGIVDAQAWSGDDGNGDFAGTGGGFSTFYAAPAWQAGITGNKMRGFPDVAFNADPSTGQEIWDNYTGEGAEWYLVGGTSIAAPQWAGFIALTQEARGSKGAVSFIPPLIYGAAPALRSTLFVDVVKGTNGAYNAAAGWDPTTGWGSPSGKALFDFLVSQ